MDKWKHYKIYEDDKGECSVFTCSIRISEINDLHCCINDFEMKNGWKYSASLCCTERSFLFRIMSENPTLNCSISMFIGSEASLYSTNLSNLTRFSDRTNQFYYDLVELAFDNECLQKLKQHPNDTLFLVCRVYFQEVYPVKTNDTSMDTSLNYLKKLGVALRNSSAMPHEKVVLQVGEQTETVSKALLCAVSPVFNKMFQNDMRERKANVVTVADIRMDVIKVLVSFLYSGKLPDCEFDFLCDLYYAADKYDITELRELCIGLLLPKISMENIFRALKLALTHNIEWFKFAVGRLISENIDTLSSTSNWRSLVDDEPQIAGEILNLNGDDTSRLE